MAGMRETVQAIIENIMREEMLTVVSEPSMLYIKKLITDRMSEKLHEEYGCHDFEILCGLSEKLSRISVEISPNNAYTFLVLHGYDMSKFSIPKLRKNLIEVDNKLYRWNRRTNRLSRIVT